jgi:hypothetical protein
MCQDLEHAVSFVKAIPAEEGARANLRIAKLFT